MKKTIFALILVAMFIMSIGAVYAAGGDNKGNGDNNATIGGSDSFSKCRQLYWRDNINTDCRQKEFCGAYMYYGLRTFETKEDCMQNVVQDTEKAKERIDNIRQLRDNQQQALADARDKLQQVREKYKEAVQNHKDAMEKFNDQKMRLGDACKQQNQTACDDAKEAIKADAKDYLTKIADKIIEHLEKLKARVQSSEELADAEKADMAADIDAKIAEVNAFKASAGTAATKEEIQKAAKDLKGIWNGMEKQVKLNAERVVNARLGNIAERADHLSERLDAKIASMKAKGLDTSKVEPLIAEFKALVASAKAHYAAAEAKFAEAKASTDPSNDLIKQAMDEMKAGQQALKDAYAKVKEILNAIRDAGDTEPIAGVTTTTEAA